MANKTETGLESTWRLIEATGLDFYAKAKDMVDARQTGKITVELFFKDGLLDQPPLVHFKVALR